jgi:hypothetical protein
MKSGISIPMPHFVPETPFHYFNYHHFRWFEVSRFDTVMSDSYGGPNPMVAAAAGAAGPPPGPPPPQQFDPDQLAFIFTAGISTGVMLLFVVRRIIRRIILRTPLKLKLDAEGRAVVKRGASFFGWPGMVITKISLRSFYTVGVPSVGSMIMIFLFMGIAAFAILFLSGLDLDDLADRFG